MTAEDRRTRRLRELEEDVRRLAAGQAIVGTPELEECFDTIADRIRAVLDTEGDRQMEVLGIGNELLTWERAARILGERLAPNGPVNYYDFSPADWLTWAEQQIADTEGDRQEPQDAKELRTVVRDMRLSAIDRLCADVPKLWPNLSARRLAVIIGALGEISITEAREALSRTDTEGA